MANNPLRHFLKSLVATILSILLAFSSCSASAANIDIGIYWGRNSSEGSLRDACSSGLYKYVSIAHLAISGDGSSRDLNLDGHCLGPLITCPIIGFDINYCQRRGIKVLLSLSGAVNDNADTAQAKDLADHIYSRYLNGWSFIRPLGQGALDGVDFAFTGGSRFYYLELANALRKYSTATKKVYLSASPRCSTSDDTLSLAVYNGVFDYAWIQFYNDPKCDYSGGYLGVVSSWVSYNTPGTKMFVGLPASDSAAKTGFIPADTFVEQVLPLVKSTPEFGGVMIWNRNFDKGYSKEILAALNSDSTSVYVS